MGGPGSEHMVALSCVCLATRGVEAVVISRRLVRPEASANCGYGGFLPHLPCRIISVYG